MKLHFWKYTDLEGRTIERTYVTTPHIGDGDNEALVLDFHNPEGGQGNGELKLVYKGKEILSPETRKQIEEGRTHTCGLVLSKEGYMGAREEVIDEKSKFADALIIHDNAVEGLKNAVTMLYDTSRPQPY